VRLRHTHELSAEFRGQLRDFLETAFDGDFDADDFDHALGGVHVTVEDATGLLGHAAVVQRRVVVGDFDRATTVRTGYVEAVAVAAHARRRGIGATLMAEVDRIVDAGFDMGLLAASDQGMPLYLRRGWTPWTGRLGVYSPTGTQMTPDDDGCVLARLTAASVDVDLTSRLYCDWRDGAPW